MWCFLSSSGGITAGRRNASSALFPYYTEDKLTDHVAATGGATVLRLADPATSTLRLWDVFACGVPDQGVSARLYKSVLGDVVTFEREHEELKVLVRSLADQPALRSGPDHHYLDVCRPGPPGRGARRAAQLPAAGCDAPGPEPAQRAARRV